MPKRNQQDLALERLLEEMEKINRLLREIPSEIKDCKEKYACVIDLIGEINDAIGV